METTFGNRSIEKEAEILIIVAATEAALSCGGCRTRYEGGANSLSLEAFCLHKSNITRASVGASDACRNFCRENQAVILSSSLRI